MKTKKKKNIILIGAGGHCVSAIDVIEKEKKYKIFGLIDNKKNYSLTKYKIIGNDKNLYEIQKKIDTALITIGQIKDLYIREKIFKEMLNLNFFFPVIVSPLAYLSKSAIVGDGTIIMHKAIVNAKAKIGKNCIINTGAIIEHDVVIGDNCHISTGSIVNGGAQIGNNTFIGSGSVIKQNIKLGSGSLINAKKFIDKDLKKFSKVL